MFSSRHPSPVSGENGFELWRCCTALKIWLGVKLFFVFFSYFNWSGTFHRFARVVFQWKHNCKGLFQATKGHRLWCSYRAWLKFRDVPVKLIFFGPFLSLKEKKSFPHMFVSKQNHWFSLKVFNFLSHSWPSLSLRGVLQVSLSTELCAEFTRCLFRWDLRILPSSEHPSMPI